MKRIANSKLFGETPELAAALLPSGMTGCARFQLERTEYVLRPLASSCESLAVHPSCLKSSRTNLNWMAIRLGHMLCKCVRRASRSYEAAVDHTTLLYVQTVQTPSGLGRSDLHPTRLLDYTLGLELCLPLMQSSKVRKCRFASVSCTSDRTEVSLNWHY